MSDLRFTEDHEWIRLEDDGTATVGVTDYAQEKLGDLVFVDLPDVGREVARGDDVAIIESVKAAGEIKAPVAGTVSAVNERLSDEPELVNQDSTGEGWFYKLEVADEGELQTLMDEEAYAALIESLED